MAIMSCVTLRVLRPIEPFHERHGWISNDSNNTYWGLGPAGYNIRTLIGGYLGQYYSSTDMYEIYTQFRSHKHTASTEKTTNPEGSHTHYIDQPLLYGHNGPNPAHMSVVLRSIEQIKVPNMCIARISNLPYLINRKVWFTPIELEPGFYDTILLNVFNTGPEPYQLTAGQPIARVAFEMLDCPVPDDDLLGR